MNDFNELYVIARQVLLDALEALAAHHDAMVLVGAQAIYLRVGDAQLAVAPFTTDGDLAIDPALLGEIPPLEQELIQAGFWPKSPDAVGMWVKKQKARDETPVEVAIDLLVARSTLNSKSRRAAQLPGHDSHAARLVEGIEGALVDVDIMPVSAIAPDDTRRFDVNVAGAAALLVAKAHKICDRQGTGREKDKDALDVFRLLRGSDTDDLAARFTKLLADSRSRATAEKGRELLREQFGKPSCDGVQMAIRAATPLMDADEIAASCEALVDDLFRLVD